MAEQESKGKLQRKKSYNRLARGILQVGACPVLGEPPPRTVHRSVCPCLPACLP
jgi:hypothetical protein